MRPWIMVLLVGGALGAFAGCSRDVDIVQAMSACDRISADSDSVTLKGYLWTPSWSLYPGEALPANSSHKRFRIAADLNGREPLKGFPVLVEDDLDLLQHFVLYHNDYVEMKGSFKCEHWTLGKSGIGSNEALGYFAPATMSVNGRSVHRGDTTFRFQADPVYAQVRAFVHACRSNTYVGCVAETQTASDGEVALINGYGTLGDLHSQEIGTRVYAGKRFPVLVQVGHSVRVTVAGKGPGARVPSRVFLNLILEYEVGSGASLTTRENGASAEIAAPALGRTIVTALGALHGNTWQFYGIRLTRER